MTGMFIRRERGRETPGLYVLREKVMWEDSNTVAVFQGKGNGLRRNLTCWPTDNEHLKKKTTSRFVRHKFLLFKPPRLIFCFGNLKSIIVIVITSAIIYTRTFQNKWITQIAYKRIKT